MLNPQVAKRRSAEEGPVTMAIRFIFAWSSWIAAGTFDYLLWPMVCIGSISAALCCDLMRGILIQFLGNRPRLCIAASTALGICAWSALVMRACIWVGSSSSISSCFVDILSSPSLSAPASFSVTIQFDLHFGMSLVALSQSLICTFMSITLIGWSLALSLVQNPGILGVVAIAFVSLDWQ